MCTFKSFRPNATFVVHLLSFTFANSEKAHIILLKKFWALFFHCRDCCAKFATGLNIIISHNSKSIWVIKLSFCQNDPLIGESFWENTSLVTLILFEQCLFWYSAQSTYFWDTLYEVIVVVHIRISLFESKNFPVPCFCSWFFFYTLKPISYILPSTPSVNLSSAYD